MGELTDTLKELADAIRSSNGVSVKLTLRDMINVINGNLIFIKNADDLVSFIKISTKENTAGKHYLQTSDIDLTGIDCGIVRSFSGVYDGGFHTVKGLTYSNPNSTNSGNGATGLFADLATGGIIKNLGVKNFSLSGYFNTGSLSGKNNQQSKVYNCWSENATLTKLNTEGNTNSYSVGGLVGSSYGVIGNCYSFGSAISGWNHQGGLIGYLGTGCRVINCASISSIITNGRSPSGALCGSIVSSSVRIIHSYGAKYNDIDKLVGTVENANNIDTESQVMDESDMTSQEFVQTMNDGLETASSYLLTDINELAQWIYNYGGYPNLQGF